MPSSKLHHWFETHTTGVITENTLFYKDLDQRRKDLIDQKVSNPTENELIICSFYDDNNFIVIGDKYLAWHSDNAKGTFALQKVAWFQRTGEIIDDRYPDRELRFFRDGKVLTREEAISESEKPGGPIKFLRLSSPLVFIKDTDGNYFEFKVEPGHHIDTFYVGINKGKKFLEPESSTGAPTSAKLYGFTISPAPPEE